MACRKDALGRRTTRDAILSLLLERRGESGIIYCLSRKSVEQMSSFLTAAGIPAGHYHAGMESKERERVQDGFRTGEVEVVAATIAFGMGIDKSNVRFVIHRDMPRSVEGYYQEIGRAGRDGVDSDCVLFHSWADVKAYDRFADANEDEAAGERLRAQSREMFRLAEADGCRHGHLVGYFGETLSEPCGNCDRCLGEDVAASIAALGRGARRRTGAVPAAHADAEPARPARRVQAVAEGDQALFDELKQLRGRLAQERHVPAYVVFSDATLIEMAARRPASEAELLTVSGVGTTKLERYGEVFLGVIARFRA